MIIRAWKVRNDNRMELPSFTASIYFESQLYESVIHSKSSPDELQPFMEPTTLISENFLAVRNISHTPKKLHVTTVEANKWKRLTGKMILLAVC